jgi:hypothetical protein
MQLSGVPCRQIDGTLHAVVLGFSAGPGADLKFRAQASTFVRIYEMYPRVREASTTRSIPSS